MNLDKKLLQPGKLVTLRGRDWVVLPSEDPDVLMVRPLGGSEDETTGIYLPLGVESEIPKEATFPWPTAEDLGDITTARLLYNAARLGFRNASGPFRAFAKLSFRPRAYQVVPLVMALRQKVVRLLIADDVGVGKTIEALLIARELLERGTVRRFAVVCPPHLCEQWSEEIKTKLGMEAAIIRASTKVKMDREVPGDTSIYQYYPYQVISVDFIKSDLRKNVFSKECPELLIVDEVHTCARPFGASDSQQQRFHLISKIAAKQGQHIVLLTATPHSGKPEEFQSLLGLLKKEYDSPDWSGRDPEKIKVLTKHIVQRKREDVEKWMGEDTPFPDRESTEETYNLSGSYGKLFTEIVMFAKKLVRVAGTEKTQSARAWAALGLLRGVMSSPRAGVQMLDTRLEKLSPAKASTGEATDVETETVTANPVGDVAEGVNDSVPAHVIERIKWTSAQIIKIQDFQARLKNLEGVKQDQKIKVAGDILLGWLGDNYRPVVFCRYIDTAKYVHDVLECYLRKKHPSLNIRVVTSEEPDVRRRELIEELRGKGKQLLIATDCLSEGINLQEQFNAVLHYDLPWNPNRLEQREGRVDRFGQSTPKVKVCLLYGKQNPIDGVVLEVLIKKIKEIKKATGISIPFPSDSQSVLDAITMSLLLRPDRNVHYTEGEQGILFDMSDFGEVAYEKTEISARIEEAAQRERESQGLFAQNAIQPSEIEQDLQAVDEAIGDPTATETFVTGVFRTMFGVQVTAETSDNESHAYSVVITNMGDLAHMFPGTGEIRKICFASPVRGEYNYIGRNHPMVERLCQVVLANTIDRNSPRAARATVMRTDGIAEKTTILMLRCRNLIENTADKSQIIAEEMVLRGMRNGEKSPLYDHREAEMLLCKVKPNENMTPEEQREFLQDEIERIQNRKNEITGIAEQQSISFAKAHTRFSRLTDPESYQVVHPVLPPDLVGLYVLIPR